MKFNQVVKEFERRQDGIYNKVGAKIADSYAELSKLNSDIYKSNVARNKYFRTTKISDTAALYGGKITPLSQLINASQTVVDAVKKAAVKRQKFANYVEDRDREFQQRYIDAVVNSGLTPEEVLEITEIYKNMTPKEFVDLHRKGEITDINMFDSEDTQLFLGKMATEDMRAKLHEYRDEAITVRKKEVGIQ